MARVIKVGEFKIKIEGDRAKAYDIRSGRKLFDGAIEDVFRDIREKVEGEVINAKRRRYL